MDPELPKKVAAASDVAKSLSAKIEEMIAHLLGLKSNLDAVHPALDQVHQSIKEGDPAYDATDKPEVVPADEVEEETEAREGHVPDARFKSGYRPE